MDYDNLPVSWQSTANSLEALAHIAKDVLLVIDNWIPRANPRAQADFERIAQAVGDRSGRSRLSSNSEIRSPKSPRAMVVSTGEDLPAGESVIGRVLILMLSPGSVDLNRLGRCQQYAKDGLYSGLMASLLAWLAPRLGSVLRVMPRQKKCYREQFEPIEDVHARTPDILAELMVGLDLLLDFAVDVNALTRPRADHIFHGVFHALQKAGGSQASIISSDSPVDRFFELLRSAFTAGLAHVAGMRGDRCPDAEAWGWQRRYDGEDGESRWQALGTRIGWSDGSSVYLDRDSALRMAQRAAPRGQSLDITPRMLSKHLHEAGKLRSTELGNARKTYTVRVSILGRQRPVLDVAQSAFFPPPPPYPESDQAFGDLLDDI